MNEDKTNHLPFNDERLKNFEYLKYELRMYIPIVKSTSIKAIQCRT